MENDMLSSLLSDPEALQNAMKTVSDLLGGQPSAQTEPQNAYDPASEMMQKALPVIGAIAQSGQNAVKPEKRALLGALKPFVAEEVSGQFAEQTAPETSEPPQSSTFSGLGRTLNARLQGVRLDMDTMIALLIVWFLLMDDDGAVDWEQFLLTAALLLFGL